ncbi:MAG: hypothetical protein IJ497_08915 [Clostridia bacterium]|nr:hypothetical protein [Clostridia bacterium]
MKKLLVLLTALILLTSCRGNNGASDVQYLYSRNIVSREYDVVTTLTRQNLETGNVTTLCADPLCDHSTESGCTFADVLNFEVDAEKGLIYFCKNIRTDDGEEAHVCVYDIAGMQARTLHVYRDGMDSMWTTAFRFGYCWRISSVTDDGIDDYCVSMTEQNFDEPTVMPVNTMPFAEGNRFWYYAEQKTAGGYAVSFYLQDKEFKEEPVVIAEDLYASDYRVAGEWLYFLQNKILYRIALDGSYPAKPEALVENVADYTVSGGKIFFLRREEKPVSVGYDVFLEEEIYNTCGSTLWIADPETETVKVFAELDDYVIGLRKADYVDGKIVLGYGIWTEEDGVTRWRSGGGGIIVVDAHTGDWMVHPNA